MDRLNNLTPAIVGAGILAFAVFTLAQIKLEQARSRERRDAEE